MEEEFKHNANGGVEQSNLYPIGTEFEEMFYPSMNFPTAHV